MISQILSEIFCQWVGFWLQVNVNYELLLMLVRDPEMLTEWGGGGARPSKRKCP